MCGERHLVMTSVQNLDIAFLKVVDRMLFLPHHKIFLHEVLSLLRCFVLLLVHRLQPSTDESAYHRSDL